MPFSGESRAAAIPVLHPGMKLAQAQGFLGLRDRAPADAGEDELVPELVELAEFGIFPRLFTSWIAVSSATLRLPSRAPIHDAQYGDTDRQAGGVELWLMCNQPREHSGPQAWVLFWHVRHLDSSRCGELK